MADIRAITLDLDGTLWPIWPVIEAAERDTLEWFAEHAPRVTEEHTIDSMRAVRTDIISERPDIAHDMGALRLEVFRKVVADHHYPDAMAQAAYDVFYQTRCRVEPYAEVLEVLAAWSGRYALAAVTNGNADLQRTSLADLLPEAIRAGDQGFAKPDARLFQHACNRLGSSAGQTLHIGDHPQEDIEGARDAGLNCIWMNRSQQPWPLDTPEPLMVDDLRQVDALIATL